MAMKGIGFGKVILFGEHSVVYNKLAIATAIDKRVRVKLQINNGNDKNKNNLILNQPNYGKVFETNLDECISLYNHVE